MAKHDVTLTAPAASAPPRPASRQTLFVLALLALSLLAPLGVYPVFLMKALCFALFASAFNLLLGYVGLLSFGHAMFFGWSAYVTAHAAKEWGLTPELAVLAGVALAAATVIFMVMVVVLLVKPAGLFGKGA
ncbi:MAG: ABC transporter permease subunit [Bacteroidales bacterium]